MRAHGGKKIKIRSKLTFKIENEVHWIIFEFHLSFPVKCRFALSIEFENCTTLPTHMASCLYYKPTLSPAFRQ